MSKEKFSTMALAIIGGLLIFLFAIVFSFFLNPYGTFPILVFILCLSLPPFCWFVSRGKPNIWLAIAICAAGPYILFASYAFVVIVRESNEYDGVFWYADYSPISFLLYLSVPILSLLAAFGGSIESRANVWMLVVAVLFFISLGICSVASVDSSIRESSVTLEFVETPEIALSAQAYCNYWNYNLYWFFRRVEGGNCECNRIVVQRRSPDVHLSYLSTKVLWKIDGVEEEAQIFPNGEAGIVLDKNGLPDKERNDWSNRREWNTQIPYKKILNASNVTFTWGDVTHELSDSERNSFSKIIESYKSLK